MEKNKEKEKQPEQEGKQHDNEGKQLISLTLPAHVIFTMYIELLSTDNCLLTNYLIDAMDNDGLLYFRKRSVEIFDQFTDCFSMECVSIVSKLIDKGIFDKTILERSVSIFRNGKNKKITLHEFHEIYKNICLMKTDTMSEIKLLSEMSQNNFEMLLREYQISYLYPDNEINNDIKDWIKLREELKLDSDSFIIKIKHKYDSKRSYYDVSNKFIPEPKYTCGDVLHLYNDFKSKPDEILNHIRELESSCKTKLDSHNLDILKSQILNPDGTLKKKEFPFVIEEVKSLPCPDKYSYVKINSFEFANLFTTSNTSSYYIESEGYLKFDNVVSAIQSINGFTIEECFIEYASPEEANFYDEFELYISGVSTDNSKIEKTILTIIAAMITLKKLFSKDIMISGYYKSNNLNEGLFITKTMPKVIYHLID